ncbi:MAG: hypothetical protein ACLQHK_05540 [Gallionellaceae bacterium]
MDSQPTPARCPDICTCRANYSGIGDLFYCLNDMRGLCDYAMPFGDSFFCHHPQNIEIAARSNIAEGSPDGATRANTFNPGRFDHG